MSEGNRIVEGSWVGECPGQDLNLHVHNRTQAPQACASANSATRAAGNSPMRLPRPAQESSRPSPARRRRARRLPRATRHRPGRTDGRRPGAAKSATREWNRCCNTTSRGLYSSTFVHLGLPAAAGWMRETRPGLGVWVQVGRGSGHRMTGDRSGLAALAQSPQASTSGTGLPRRLSPGRGFPMMGPAPGHPVCPHAERLEGDPP